MDKAYVFISNKDKNSYTLLQELKKINNWKELFSIISVHSQKNLVKQFNIRRVPSIVWDNTIFEGQDALSFINENKQEEENPGNNNVNLQGPSFSDYENEDFSTINQNIPTFTSIEESGFSQNNDLDLNTRMQQYNSQRKNIDNLIEKKKSSNR